MDNKYFVALDYKATIADILSVQEDEFNSFINKLKKEYKNKNQIKAKPKAQKPLNFVLQQMRKMSQHYMRKCGAWGRNNYLDMNMLLDSVYEQHEDELKSMGYSKKLFLLDFSSEIAVLMTSGIFQRSYTFSQERGMVQLSQMEMASYLVFKGTEYHKNPTTGKKEAKCFPKIACSEGIDQLINLNETGLFKGFGALDYYISQCAVVGKLFVQDPEKGLKTDTIPQLLQTGDLQETLPSLLASSDTIMPDEDTPETGGVETEGDSKPC